MEYPLISEYREAILSAEDNFNELASLRPVLDSHGDPVMSSGNFAVVFKMRDENDGKLYAVKCFIKDQEGRDESYRKIADELETVSSSYILPLRYLEKELFVDTGQCDQEEFPVVVMEWVDGETLDGYLKRQLNDRYELDMLSYRFNRMAAWLLAQPFAHGDLKPDNILIRKDGSLVLVDYDGMFVPTMKGEKAREIGSPDYRHPSRTASDFDEHIDDFSIAVIALSLKAIALNPNLKLLSTSTDTLLLSEKDYTNPSESEILKGLQTLLHYPEFALLFGAFSIAFANNSLDLVSFRLFMTAKPIKYKQSPKPHLEKLSTEVTKKDIEEGIADEHGVIYSKDGLRLLKCKSYLNISKYQIKSGTKVIGDRAFSWCKSLHSVIIPDSVTSIGNDAFCCCDSLQSITIPGSVTTIRDNPFNGCPNIKIQISNNNHFRIVNNLLISSNGVLISCLDNSENITIPDSVTTIGNSAFCKCKSLQSVTIPDSVTSIGDRAFSWSWSLQSVAISNSITSIGKRTFFCCESLQSVTIPDTVTIIDEDAFFCCKSLQNVSLPNSLSTIGRGAFVGCGSLNSVALPNTNVIIGDNAFPPGCLVFVW